MIINLDWLKEFLNTKKTAYEICDKLNNIGLEVENIIPEEKIFEKIVVAEIQECENHPDSNHLHICKVFDGKEIHQVVCGASNARKGIKVALALIGAYIPNGDFKIKKSKIRGIESCGMMCSEREMGISDDHEGIMELPDECKIGELWVKEYHAIDKMPIEISITPNRGDAASIYGIARDLSACNFGELNKIENIEEINETLENNFSVNVKIDNCKYLCREIRNINPNIATPKYILKRNALNGCGDNGFVVNVLNYIMFAYGQPMHSYDADKIGKNITIDYTKNDIFKTLKNEEIKLNKKILTVQDDNKDLCIAGIIGGEECKTTNETKNILLECAYFPTDIIATGGQELKIVSDARFRYERGVNPDITKEILNIATKMILELCGGKVSNIVECCKTKENKIIEYDVLKTKQLTGFDISIEKSVEILKLLEFEILAIKDNILTIKIPNFRHDIENQEDICEELARIEGYSNIPENNFIIQKISKNVFNEKIKAKKYLASNGLKECISFAFCDEENAKLFVDQINEDLKLLNPISNDLNYMRPTILISLLQAIKVNESNILENQLAFFEEGIIFEGLTKEKQKNSISCVYCGNCIKNDHFKEGRLYDIFDAKKNLFELLENIYKVNTKNISIENSKKKYAHPTRSFDLILKGKDGEKVIATFGEISPIVLKKFNIKNNVCFFELLTNDLKGNKNKKMLKKQMIQPIVRDISFIIDKEIKSDKIINAYKDDIIADIKIVDIFDINIENKKSISVRYTFEPKENITIEQIDEIMNKIIKSVEDKTGGKVRDGK